MNDPKVWALLLVCCGAAAAQEPAAPTGPESYWRLDETAGTTAANRVTGAPVATYQNGPTPSATVPALSYNSDPGVTPRSLQFNGTNQGLTVPSFGTFTSFSVSAWIQRTGTSAARESIVSYKESGTLGFVLCLNEDATNYYPRIWVRVGATWQFAEQALTVGTGAWVHLAASYDGTTIRLYRNGAEVALLAIAGTMTNGTAATAIGMRSSNDVHWYPGMVDDVRIYSRALTPGEVSVLGAGVPAPTALVATPGVNQVTLNWTAAAAPAVGTVTYTYNVLRRLTGVGNYVSIQTGIMGTTYIDTTAAGGTAYDYAVTALSAAESGLSTPQTNILALIPQPRVNDHNEGLLDDNCSCGAAAPGAPLPASLALAGLALLALRRRQR